jgi:hypothetical protein
VRSYPAGTLTFVAGMALLIPASLGLLLIGVPTILCPLPLLTTIPAFLLQLGGCIIWRPVYQLCSSFFGTPASFVVSRWFPGDHMFSWRL